MAAAADVSFDILLGGKVTPEVLKSFKTMEDLLKKQGASVRTVNAIMSRAYKETFDQLDKDARKSFDAVEKKSRETFHKIAEQAREAQKKVGESFERMREGFDRLKESANKVFEFTGLAGLTAAVGGALTIEELVKHGVEVRRERETEEEVLAATLRGRGRGLETREWSEAAEQLAAHARVGHKEAMEMMTKLAASGRFKSAEQAQQMAMSLTGLGGGTSEGAAQAMQAYQRMLLTGKLNPRMIAAIGRGSGINVLQQLSRDTGIPVADLTKQFAEAKVSKKGVVTGGALAGARGIEALNKAIEELGKSRGMELVAANMKGMDGLFYRLSEHWEDFSATIGEFIEKIISPLAEEINSWLDTINFREIFDEMIEKAKEWGQLIKAVWDTIANSPVLNRIKAMWENFWTAFTGGIELYGPYVDTWNDNLHHELGTHLARHMTDAGKKWVEETSDKVQAILKNITDAFQWFIDNGASVWFWVQTIGLAFIFLKAIEVGKWVYDMASAFGELLGVTKKVTAAIGISEGLTGAFNALMVPLGALSALLSAVGLIKGPPSTEPHVNRVAALTEERSELEQGHVSKLAQLSGQLSTAFDDATIDTIKKQIETENSAYAQRHKAIEEEIRTQQNMADANNLVTDSMKKFEGAVKKSTGNDLVHFTAATTAATVVLGQLSASMSSFGTAVASTIAALGQLSASMAGFGAGFAGGLAGGSVTGAHFTEYGPGVAGDQPGGATYDWNSYHHIGAWPNITGPLRAGDVALGVGAQAKYHVSPGQMFTDEYGRTWRFADRSGSSDPYNVDVFKGFALGGIVKRPTRALLGESGPEAVLPLSGAGAAAASGLGGLNITVNVAGNADDPEHIARAVQRVVEEHWRRSAVV